MKPLNKGVAVGTVYTFYSRVYFMGPWISLKLSNCHQPIMHAGCSASYDLIVESVYSRNLDDIARYGRVVTATLGYAN